MTLRDRAMAYCRAFPQYPPLRADDRWIDGMWFTGNNYKGSGYHGAYPPQYLKRIMSLFPDKTESREILHLFSGSLPKGDYITCDLNPENDPDIICSAEELSSVTGFVGRFDLILADPPYSDEDANKYGYPMVNRNKVVSECSKILKVGGHLVWLDQVLPMYRKAEIIHCGAIGMVRSTNHRFRVVSIFEKQGAQKGGGE